MYEIQRESSQPTYWDVFLDFNYYGTSYDQGSSAAYEHQAGLEIPRAPGGTVGTWAHADNFTNNYLQTRLVNSYTWYYWSYFNYWIDQPCGPWPAGSCLNGQMYRPNGIYQWQDNKP